MAHLTKILCPPGLKMPPPLGEAKWEHLPPPWSKKRVHKYIRLILSKDKNIIDNFLSQYS